jgi:hypothetical protein
VAGYRSWLLLYEFIVVTIISVVGLAECFKAMAVRTVLIPQRLSVIGVPIGIKVALAAIVLGQASYVGFGYIVTPTTVRNPTFVYELYSFAFAAAFMFVFYWRIALTGQPPRPP